MALKKIESPCWLYHPSVPMGRIFDQEDEDAMAAAIAEGWLDSPAAFNVDGDIPEENEPVLGKRPASPENPEPDTKGVLVARARALGVRADRRMSEGTIQALIDAQLADDPGPA